MFTFLCDDLILSNIVKMAGVRNFKLLTQVTYVACGRQTASLSTSTVVWSSGFKSDPEKERKLLQRSNKNGVTLLKMNDPRKLNGWTGPMMMAMRNAFKDLAADDSTQVAVLTGADPYYCAGVNLSDTMKPMHPATLHKLIVQNNAAIFNAFIEFPKPLIVAVNGPAIGACVTSATLADAIIASEKATFSTPFARLGIVPEGCSSVHFERIMGKTNAERMLGPEGWAPTGQEAKEAGFVSEVVRHEDLVNHTLNIAEKWVKDKKSKRFAQGHGSVEEYLKVNLEESHLLADAFLSVPFLEAQQKFLASKGKTQLAQTFKMLLLTRPLWKLLLPKPYKA